MGSIDEEIFEITDFTCATDWERFVSDLESRIRDWQLNDEGAGDSEKKKKNLDEGLKENFKTMKFDRFVETLHYGEKIELKISYIFPQSMKLDSPVKGSPSASSPQKKSTKIVAKPVEPSKHSYIPSAIRGLLEQSIDFVHESIDMGHNIVRYYGLRQFVVLEPGSIATSSGILADDNFINLLTSAILVAALNTGCDLPVFLQVADQWRWLYNGVCQNDNTRTYFEMAHLRNPPPKCCHLSGILDTFKEQVASAFIPPPPVKVSLRITYVLREAFESNWPSQMDDMDGSPLSNFHGKRDYARLPFGAVQDTLDKWYLSCTWLNLNEDMLVENDVYSDLDPLTAPYWNTTVDFSDVGVMLMTEALSSFLRLAGCHKTVDDILGPSASEKSTAAGALGRLTNRSLLEFSVLQSATSKLSLSPAAPASVPDRSSPLDDAQLTNVLQFLFPDAGLEESDGNTCVKPKINADQKEGDGDKKSALTRPGSVVSVSSTVKNTSEMTERKEKSENPMIEAILKKSKSAPIDSLTSRVALVVCRLAQSMQERLVVAHMWREFVLELRYRWEQGITLPGFGDSHPILADCLLQQKLQMLNCCILHKLRRQQQQQVGGDVKSAGSSASSKGTDEFFDCYEDTDEIDLATASKPEGRFQPLGPDVFLVENNHEPLYIPLTQNPAPVTEDTLELHSRTLTNMGTSDESAFARAKMQTPSLLSDMEAFKAANPNSVMEDFIRWYSPRDWVEELDRETGRLTGRLSDRMATPGNLWREVWENARPIPVSRQKRLFDDTTEAEKILHWLYGMQISELTRHLAAPLFACALKQMNEEAGVVDRLLTEKWKAVTSQYSQATLRNSSLEYEDLKPLVSDIERTISQYRSLLSRLSNSVVPNEESESDVAQTLQAFVLELLTEKDVKILGASRGLLGQLLSNMFSKDDRLRFETKSENSQRFPPYYSKEYLLRWMVPRPQAKSRECPQRFYVRVKANEFRAASAFTEDVVFFLPEK